MALCTALLPAIALTYDLSGREISLPPKEIIGILLADNRGTSGISGLHCKYVVEKESRHVKQEYENLFFTVASFQKIHPIPID